MDDPDFSAFDNFAPPFGSILFYLFCFIITVILLNILIALFGTSYDTISENSTDEFLALFSLKTLQFVRAPDENVFIAPFNLVEIFGLVVPFEWWLSNERYERLNSIVMGVIYSPLLVVTAFVEQRDARKVLVNRRRGEADDDTDQEWEVMGWKVDDGGDEAWCEKVKKTSPDPAKNPIMEELQELRKQIEELRGRIEERAEA